MDLRERKKKGCSNRPRRSVVENNERNKVERREKDAALIAALGSSFERYVTEHVMFPAHVQLELDENQNPSVQRDERNQRDELIAKLGSNRRRRKRFVSFIFVSKTKQIARLMFSFSITRRETSL